MKKAVKTGQGFNPVTVTNHVEFVWVFTHRNASPQAEEFHIEVFILSHTHTHTNACTHIHIHMHAHVHMHAQSTPECSH